MEIKIVSPTEVSWQEYRDLRLRALKEEADAFASSHADEIKTADLEWQERLDRYREGKHNWMFFAKQNNKLVGMVGAYQNDENITENTAYLMAMFVVKEARGQKISKLLMERLLAELAKHYVKKVKLGVGLHRSPAFNLYKSVGFEIIAKEHVLLGDGEYHDEYIMEKKLE